jgi:hypothetical protein
MSEQESNRPTVPATRGKLRTVLGRLIEAVLALGLVLVCFGVFLAILGLSFPQGTALASLVDYAGLTREVATSGRFDLGIGRITDEPPAFSARVVEVLRRVKQKPAGAITWADARSGSRLGDRHAVQSFARARAVIAFDHGSELTLDENTLIVIRDRRATLTSSASAAIVIMEGALSGRIVTGADAETLSIATRGASMSLDATDLPSEFVVTVGEDQAATYTVYDGTATVQVGDDVVTVRANEAVTVDAEGRPGPVVSLPDAPTPTVPDPQRSVYFRSQPPRIGFDWTTTRDTDAYRFELAHDERFLDLVHTARLSEPHFIHGNLKAGTYHWRVRALRGPAPGPPSRPRRITLVQDLEPPELVVDFPHAVREDGRVTLRGRVEPGSVVFVGDERLTTQDSGEFEYAFNARNGPNLLVLEAVDAAGNITYRSGTVHATQQSWEGQP